MPELLIVDDDEALRRWEERVVRDQGYSCDSACDASTVREQLQQSSYKLALLDVNMPGESGIELLAHIRRSHPEVAVLMVTGEDSTKLAMTAIEHGAYGYLVKPVGSGELLINVANALHRRRAEMQNHRLVQRLQEQRADERESQAGGSAAGPRALRDQGVGLPGRNDLPAGSDWSSSATRRPGTTCIA